MAQTTSLFLFGDQTHDFIQTLRGLLADRDSVILQAFLDQSYYVIRTAMIRVLTPEDYKASRSSSMSQFVQKYLDKSLNPAFQTALLCVCQLGSFIREFESPDKPYPSPNDTYVLGVCTGSLAAAAISCASSLSELLPLAVQTVSVAFRLGIRAYNVGCGLDIDASSSKQPWSTVLLGIDSTRIVSIIQESEAMQALPKARRPWISATSSKGTTVSGSPTTLTALLSAPELSNLKSFNLPVYVPSHNPGLFFAEDVSSILDNTSETLWARYKSRIPFVSSVTGKLAWVSNFHGLLKLALENCLLHPIGWDEVEQKLPGLLKSRGASHVKIIPVSSSSQLSLSSALEAGDVHNTVAELDGRKGELPHRPGALKSKLAIVGMSGRFPEAQNLDEFWDVLYQGVDTCKEVPQKRWNVETHVDPSGKAHNKGATRWGCWLDFSGQFDPRFFGISPKEAPQMDPAQRMALMSTWEAMERAGLVADTTPSTQRDRIGVFHGVTSNDWMETNTAQNIDTYFITGGNRGFIPGRINFCFEFSGPSYSNDTACSSSLAAIHLACNSLWRGDCDTAVAGGTNMIYTPDGHTGLDKGFFLSRTGNCKPFDDAADGYCRAEAVGTVIIKRLEDAIADHDPILGVILDAKTNHSAMSESMTRPHVGAQIDNMTSVINTSGIHPNDLSYIEMHGTGTQVGDAVEMESVLSIFAPSEITRPPDSPLFVGSAKANVGHGEGVSGVTSLIKVLLMMQQDTIVPHCGIKPGSRINRHYPDLGARNVHIASEPVPWPRSASPRRVLINNFSAAGGNTALLVEDAPDLLHTGKADTQQEDPRDSHIIAISAHVGKSLKMNLEALLEYLERSPATSLRELAYTTTARRWHFPHRVGIVASSVDDAKRSLKRAIEDGDGINRPKSKSKVLFAFTGQGSQYSGMGKHLYAAYPKFRTDLEQFDKLAKAQGLPSFLHIYAPSQSNITELLPAVVQLAIVCLEMALTNLLQSFGIVPGAVVGHSLGEYAALYATGVCSASDTIYLVGKRAELLQERCQLGTHAMLAVRAERADIESLVLNANCEVACVNGPKDIVLSGGLEGIMSLHRLLSSKGLKCTLLQLPFAFHSAQVEPILTEFETLAEVVSYRKPRVPILSPLLGRIIDREDILGGPYLARHCREPVDMNAALQYAKGASLIDSNTIMVEIGPKPLICGMLKATLGNEIRSLPTLSPEGSVWQNLHSILSKVYVSGHELNWQAYQEPFDTAKHVLDLPTYKWYLQEYYIPYDGDWCLHRHRLDCDCAHPGREVATAEYKLPTIANNQATDGIRSSKLSKTEEAYPQIPTSATIHRLVAEHTQPLGGTMTVETNMCQSDLLKIAQGHIVDGIPLVSPSLFAEVAFQLGKYTMNRIRAGHAGAIDGMVDVSNMVIDNALIAHGQSPQFLHSTLSVQWPPKAAATTRSAKIQFSSYLANGDLETHHAACTVRFVTDSQLKTLTNRVPEYRSRIQALRDGIMRGSFVRYNSTSGYKLMSGVTQFHTSYKLLDDLVLDEEQNESTCRLAFPSTTTAAGMGFTAHPAHVDAITQLAGFTMNAKDETDIQKELYVNHGWESFQLYQPLDSSKVYDVYTKMSTKLEADLVHGDIIVLHDNAVVAFFKGISLRRVARKALQAVLKSGMDRAIRKRGGKLQAAPPIKIPSVQQDPEIIKETPLTKAQPKDVKSVEFNEPRAASAIPSDEAKESHFCAVLAVIAEESGVALDEFTDEVNFVEIGIDSLSSMVIGSRLREDMALDLAPEFSLFVDCPTVRSLKDFMGIVGKKDAECGIEPNATKLPSENGSHRPAADNFVSPQNNDHNRDADAAVHGTMFVSALAIVAEESGVAAAELVADTIFADIGIDSLNAMVITSRFREELGLGVDSSFSFFSDVPDVSALKKFLHPDLGNGPSQNAIAATECVDLDPPAAPCGQNKTSFNNMDSSGTSSAVSSTSSWTVIQRQPHCRPTSSVILQGLPRLAQKTLFLLPDGGGSASSYIPLPRLRGDISVVGLNCPYARDPENMDCTHVAMIESFCTEIRRRQPQGPYHLGGWSSGGAFAYVVAEALVRNGDEVHSLIIIDAPVPQVMEKLPDSFYEHCNKVGLFANQPGGSIDGNSKPPAYLIPHFQAVVDVMLDYKVAPLQTRRMPTVGLVWAADTVLKSEGAPDIQGMHFMVQQRTNFGPDGWDTVLPGANFDIVKATGANHFTLMSKEHVHLISDLIDRVMS